MRRTDRGAFDPILTADDLALFRKVHEGIVRDIEVWGPALVWALRVADWLVRVCPRCEREFYTGKRKRIYCSAKCTRLAQWAKYVAKHPTRERDYRAEYRKRRAPTGMRP